MLPSDFFYPVVLEHTILPATLIRLFHPLNIFFPHSKPKVNPQPNNRTEPQHRPQPTPPPFNLKQRSPEIKA